MSSLDGTELIELWRNKNRAFSLEGDRALEKLEGLFKLLGYQQNGFRFGSPVERFLSDNPRALEAILEFIGEWVDHTDDWRENLEEELEEEIAEKKKNDEEPEFIACAHCTNVRFENTEEGQTELNEHMKSRHGCE
jgi:hypothetical protein